MTAALKGYRVTARDARTACVSLLSMVVADVAYPEIEVEIEIDADQVHFRFPASRWRVPGPPAIARSVSFGPDGPALTVSRPHEAATLFPAVARIAEAPEDAAILRDLLALACDAALSAVETPAFPPEVTAALGRWGGGALRRLMTGSGPTPSPTEQDRPGVAVTRLIQGDTFQNLDLVAWGGVDGAAPLPRLPLTIFAWNGNVGLEFRSGQPHMPPFHGVTGEDLDGTGRSYVYRLILDPRSPETVRALVDALDDRDRDLLGGLVDLIGAEFPSEQGATILTGRRGAIWSERIAFLRHCLERHPPSADAA